MQSNSCRKIVDPKSKEINLRRGEARKEVMGCAVHGTPGEELLISEKGKQTMMVKAKGIMESSQSKRGKRKGILQPWDNSLLTPLTTSSLFVGVFVTSSALNVCAHTASEQLKASLSQTMRVLGEPQDTPKEQ